MNLTRRAMIKALMLGPAFASVLAASGMPAAVKYSTRGIDLAEINEITMRTVMPVVIDNFAKDNPVFELLKRKMEDGLATHARILDQELLDMYNRQRQGIA